MFDSLYPALGAMIYSLGPVFFVLIALVILYFIGIIIGYWRILRYYDKPGWWALIPFFNVFAVGSAVGAKVTGAAYAICSLASSIISGDVSSVLSILNTICLIAFYMEIIKAFGKPPWHIGLCILAPFIYLPLLPRKD